MALLKEMGMEVAPVVFGTDQEHAIVDLMNEVARRRQATSFNERSV